MTLDHWLIVGALIAGPVIALYDIARTDPGDFWFVTFVYIGFLSFMFLLMLSPGTTGFAHIRIAPDGLALWSFGMVRLPADQIGVVEVVPESELNMVGFHWRFRGRRAKSSGMSYSAYGREGPAVFVEQVRPGRDPRAWLLASRNPEAVAEALIRVREQAHA